MLNFSCFLLLSLFIGNITNEKTSLPINVGGENLLQIRGLNADKRAQLIYERLSVVLTENLQSKDVKIKFQNKENTIAVNDVLLLTITDKDAKENKSSKDALTKKIHKILSEKLPEVAPQPQNK